MNQEQFAKTANAGDEQVAALKEKLKLATDALAMIAKYAPTRPAAELGFAPEADASWARQAGSMAKKTLEEVGIVDTKNDLDSRLDTYLSAINQVHNYFGYVEDWKVIPIIDRRELYWKIEQEEGGGGSVLYSEEKLTGGMLEEGKHYEDRIYTQRFLKQWVYRGESHTMICVDTQTDDNKFLAIFSNSREQSEVADE